MAPQEEKKVIRDLKVNYFMTAVLTYIGFFLAVYLFINIILMILQAHPYVNLLFAILILLADIIFTDRLLNHYWKDRWIQK